MHKPQRDSSDWSETITEKYPVQEACNTFSDRKIWSRFVRRTNNPAPDSFFAGVEDVIT
jgi:hypothetical protein